MKVREIKKIIEQNPGKTQKEVAELVGLSLHHFVQLIYSEGIEWEHSKRNVYMAYREYFLENHEKKSTYRMAKELGLSWNETSNYLLDNRLTPVSDIYVLYENDEYVAEGTLYELSDISGKKPSTLLRYRRTKSRRYSTEIFRVEGDDLDEITG